MFHTFNQKFDRHMTIIHPGEFCSSTEGIIISTILGSCVSVILLDQERRCGGMNHFMLAQSSATHLHFEETTGRYGINAMELLINDMMKLGSAKSSFQAKVFGGGHVIKTGNTNAIPETNIQFALDFLKNENIPVISQDTGGEQGRKILLFPDTGQVLLKRFSGTLATKAAAEEEAYLNELRARQTRKAQSPDITLF
jgi:chemotaxis protein CheD